MLSSNRDTSRDTNDRVELTQLMSRFATGLDTCDWAMYRSVFTDEFELDYSSWRPEHLGRRRADDWVERATRLFPGLTASRHALSNLLIAFDAADPDVAIVSANVCADHVLVDDGATDVFTLNGRYEDRCVRTDNAWRIAGKRLTVLWSTGDRDVLARAAERVASGAPDLRLPGGS
jgi:hypothetical protein